MVHLYVIIRTRLGTPPPPHSGGSLCIRLSKVTPHYKIAKIAKITKMDLIKEVPSPKGIQTPLEAITITQKLLHAAQGHTLIQG